MLLLVHLGAILGDTEANKKATSQFLAGKLAAANTKPGGYRAFATTE